MPADEQKNREKSESPAPNADPKVEDLSHGSLETEQSDDVKGGMIRHRFRPEDV
jgi:hypothetical protein